MRYFALLFFVIYIFFAFLQLNDPDPVWWVTLYLIPAYVSFRTFKNKYSFELLRVLSIFYAAYAINSILYITAYEGFFLNGQGWSMKTANQELAREASGLFICVITYIIYGLYFYAKEKKVIFNATDSQI
jgi:hypothetical protein